MNKTLVLNLLLLFPFLILKAQPQLQWAGELEGTAQNYVLSTDYDPSGNLLVAGYYIDRVDLDMSLEGKEAIRESRGADGFVAKYAPDGGLIWFKTINMESSEMIKRVKADSYGNVWLAGEYSENGDMDPDPRRTQMVYNKGHLDLFVVKLSPNGETEWLKTFGTAGNEKLDGLAVDDRGNGYICGRYHRKRETLPYLGHSQHGNPDMYFAKINPQGNVLWERKLKAAGLGSAKAIDVDGSGAVYLSGSFAGKADFGTDPYGKRIVLASKGSTDMYISKFNSRGSLQWARVMGGKINDEAECLKVDDAGNVYMGGWFNSSGMDFDPHPNKTAIRRDHGRYDAFLAHFSTDGDLVWVNAIGGEAWDAVQSISLDLDGSPVVAGFFTTWAEFAPKRAGTFRLKAPSMNYQAFLAKYDAVTGNLDWAKQFGGTEDAQINSVSVDAQGYISAGGTFSGPMGIEYAPGQLLDLKGASGDKRGMVISMSAHDRLSDK